ncbi:MAG TPA: beta-L-arabinofuranosidase domain-containing protein [Tepidisphaeraceae bacterium]
MDARALVMAITLLVLVGSARESHANAKPLKPFNYEGVRLLDSHWRRQQKEVLEYYLAVPSDNYLIGFRKRAGKPAPGQELGGWYSADRFNAFGQIVSGLARLYAATGDPRAKAKTDELVRGFIDCINADGYHFYSRSCNAPHYEFDKFLGGLLDAHVYAGNAAAKEAIGRITDWAIANLDPTASYPQPPGRPNVEGYTLSENLYRAYLLTVEEKYLDFAKRWEYWAWWDKFADSTPGDLYTQPSGRKLDFYHAYSHVNSLNGLAAEYLVSHDDRYLTRLRNAFDFMRREQAYATGGFGPIERISCRTFLRDAIDWSHRHFETQCGSWAVFKVSKYLTGLTGDARYADWSEQMLYNGIGGSIPMDRDGHVQYFSDYSARGATKININPWSCCTGTRPQAVAEYTDLIYLHDEQDVFVSLFLPSELNWNRDGGAIRVRMETKFPDDDTITLTIDQSPGSQYAVHVRAPAWLAQEPEFSVNGQLVKAARAEASWFTVSRAWKSGDVLKFRLPMKLTWQPFDAGKPFPGALTFGPVALAWQSNKRNPAICHSSEQLVADLQRQAGERALWKSKFDSSVTARPWFEIGAGEKYFLYLDPAAGQYVDLGCNWRSNEHHMICEVAGSAATFHFSGTGIRVFYSLFDDAGIARVVIDEREAGTIDQFGPNGMLTRRKSLVSSLRVNTSSRSSAAARKMRRRVPESSTSGDSK